MCRVCLTRFDCAFSLLRKMYTPNLFSSALIKCQKNKTTTNKQKQKQRQIKCKKTKTETTTMSYFTCKTAFSFRQRLEKRWGQKPRERSWERVTMVDVSSGNLLPRNHSSAASGRSGTHDLLITDSCAQTMNCRKHESASQLNATALKPLANCGKVLQLLLFVARTC